MNSMQCPLCNFTSERPMLDSWDKKTILMVEVWSNHAKIHNLTDEEFRDAVLKEDDNK